MVIHLHITNNVDTRDPIGSKNKLKILFFFEDVPNLCDILPLNKTMNPFLFGVFSGRDATGTRCEGGAFAVLSPVCIVGDPVDKLRIQSRKHGGLRQTP